MTDKPARHPRLLLGITGGIAAYKTLELTRHFRRLGWELQVVMTVAARKLIGSETFAALTGRPVAHELFPRRRPTRPGTIEHIDLAQWADIILVAPATANCLGKLASGIADDLLSTLLLAVPTEMVRSGRVLIAPAMNNRMWEHPAVRRNLTELENQGYITIAPGAGELACGQSGTGRLADIEEIAVAVTAAAEGTGRLPDLSGVRVIVTAGRTEEPLDPVRVLTNRSSGKLGIALARAFRLARADIRLICGAVSVPLPTTIPTETVTTAETMLSALEQAVPECDILVMAAAIGDYRPTRPGRTKKHQSHLTIELEKTPDILKAVTKRHRPAVVIGFSHDPSTTVGRKKLLDKRLDLIVANPYPTAGADTIAATLIPARGRSVRLPARPKDQFSRRLVTEAARLFRASSKDSRKTAARKGSR